MFTLAKLAVLLSVAVSVAALPSHMARQVHHHREIAARVAQPEGVPVPEHSPVSEISARDISPPAKRLVRKKRSNGRCSNSNKVPPSSLPASDPQPSPTPTSTNNPESPSSDPADNERGKPTSTSSQDDPQPTTPASTPNQPDSTPTTTSPSPTSTSNPGGGQTYTGQGTFYSTGLGACGITNNDTQDIVAVSHTFYDSYPGYDSGNPNTNPLCGKTARVTYESTTIEVKITDRCGGCAEYDLDFSPHAFDQLADPSVGRISGVKWEIID